MKKMVLIILMAALAAGFAGAGGLDTQFGIGYNAQYFGNLADVTTVEGDASWMPYGIGAYAGVGYGFGARKVFNLGVETYVTMGVQFQSINDLFIGNIAIQGRGYAKLKPGRFLTLAGFGGIVYDFYGGSFSGSDFNFNDYAWVVGGRFTLLFLYAQWDMTFYEDPLPSRHNFGVGFAFSR